VNPWVVIVFSWVFVIILFRMLEKRGQ